MLQVNETNIFINYDKDDDKDGYDTNIDGYHYHN